MNKFVIASAIAMGLAVPQAQAGMFDFFTGGKATVEKFAVQAKTGRYNAWMDELKKTGEHELFFTCDFSVAVTCEYRKVPGDFSIRIRRVRTEKDDAAKYVLGFHDNDVIGDKFVEIAPVTWEQLLEGVTGKRKPTHIPDFELKAIVD